MSPQPGFSKSGNFEKPFLGDMPFLKTTERSERDSFLGHPVDCESRNISDLNILGLRFFTDPGGG